MKIPLHLSRRHHQLENRPTCTTHPEHVQTQKWYIIVNKGRTHHAHRQRHHCGFGAGRPLSGYITVLAVNRLCSRLTQADLNIDFYGKIIRTPSASRLLAVHLKLIRRIRNSHVFLSLVKVKILFGFADVVVFDSQVACELLEPL